MRQSGPLALDLPFTRREWGFFAAVIAIHVTLNVAVMWVEHWFIVLSGGGVPTDLVEGFALACSFAQIAILAVWASLFAGSNLLRALLAILAVCVGTQSMIWLAQLVAPAIIDYRRWAEVSGLPLIVVIFYTIQIPFWLLRFLFGWRILLQSDEQLAPRETRRYSMLQMLGWMAFLSVLLGLGQLYHGPKANGALIVTSGVATVSWLYGIPYLWATLKAKSLVWGLIVCVPVSIATTAIACLLDQWAYRMRPGTDLYQIFIFVQAGAAVAGLGTGIAARLFGYRLYTSARMQIGT